MAAWKLRRVSVEGKEWSQLVSANPHLIFHQNVWAGVIKDGLGGETRCMLFEKNGDITGGMLGFYRRFLWARFLFFNVPYGGVIGQAPPGGELAGLLDELARREGVSRVRIVNGPGIPPAPPEGFEVIPNQTHALEIRGRSYQEMWKAFAKNIRRDVRRAERSGVTLEEAHDPSAVSRFYSLYLESMRRNRAVPKYNRKLVAAVFRRVVSAGQGALWLARRENRIVAGILVVDSPRASHYLLGGSRTDALTYCPNDLLLAEAIKRAAEKKLDYFDFLPSTPGDTGLVRFKAKWGAVTLKTDTLDLITRPLSVRLFNGMQKLAETGPFRFLLYKVQNKR